MVKTYRIVENPPFPNHPLPVLYYPHALDELLEQSDPAERVKAFFNNNGYSNSWVNGIYAHHHFHSNTHEVLGCVAGRGRVQLGGPGNDEYPFNKGDVILLPAGTAHKLTDSTDDFKVVGAYPNGMDPDMQRGEAPDYDEVQKRSYDVLVPATDPVTKFEGPVHEYW
ncbi:cupin domain-containing protein [Alkalibacterium sp. f15]|uniref:cupin domain-containing protein n=1 Tax=Alkalibacterium sp. f15 TaxID=3414029 RepID=UPI003BF7B74F